MSKMGICCGCQSSVSLHRRGGIWITDQHDIVPGVPCDGEFMCPQVIIDNGEREFDPYFDPDYDVVDPEW